MLNCNCNNVCLPKHLYFVIIEIGSVLSAEWIYYCFLLHVSFEHC